MPEKKLGKWKLGKNGASIVTETAISDYMEQSTLNTKSAIDFYGGYLIAESVPEELQELIALVPEMVRALMFNKPDLDVTRKIRRLLEIRKGG